MGGEAEALDLDHLRGWIGREEEASDVVDLRLARSLQATLGQDPAALRLGDPAPLCIHWCLAPAIVPEAETGPDGHPARGGFLPPVPLPRRMWAGGEIEFHRALAIGDMVARRSRIEDVSLKHGRSGALCFVAVRHRYEVDGQLAIDERHDIVYRAEEAAPRPPAEAPTQVASAEGHRPAYRRSFHPTSLTLFRYSALTFNGHRIHYDEPYARETEGYPGLVVHGPLQATLLAQLAASALEAPLRRFVYRGVRPMCLGGALDLSAEAPSGHADPLTLHSSSNGRVHMEAKAWSA
jgi:3-methylfumaryl-CoA hydratase